MFLLMIKHFHTILFGKFNVIITKDFYQVYLIRDVGVFKTNANNINNLVRNFWMEKIKCYELKQIMRQMMNNLLTS
jgi:hypothetical protein